MRGLSLTASLMLVSILAHPDRWALQPTMFKETSKIAVSILAHPDRWALRGFGLRHDAGCIVSILAHPDRWALLVVDRHRLISGNSFNPRPP